MEALKARLETAELQVLLKESRNTIEELEKDQTAKQERIDSLETEVSNLNRRYWDLKQKSDNLRRCAINLCDLVDELEESRTSA